MKDIYDKALKKWGILPQLNVAIEEAAEFIKAVAKVIRYKIFKPIKDYGYPTILNNLIDEIADLSIMITQINRHYGIDKAVKEKIVEKLSRLKWRIENE